MEFNRLKSSHWVDPGTHITYGDRLVTEHVKMHLHEYYEMEVVLSGKGYQNLNGTLYPLEPGSVYFLTPIDFHEVVPNGEIEIANLSFDEGILSPEMQVRFANRRSNIIFLADDQLSGQLQFLFQMLSGECTQEDTFSPQMRRNLLETLLVIILRHMQTPVHSYLPNAQIHEAMQYLFCHFRERITLSQLAKKSGYTPNYFSKLFQDTCGIGFTDFLSNLRLNYAKMLLLSTDLSVADVADKSGFGTPSGLFRKFQKYYGRTPDSFRRIKI